MKDLSEYVQMKTSEIMLFRNSHLERFLIDNEFNDETHELLLYCSHGEKEFKGADEIYVIVPKGKEYMPLFEAKRDYPCIGFRLQFVDYGQRISTNTELTAPDFHLGNLA